MSRGGVFRKSRARWVDAGGRRVGCGTPGAIRVEGESTLFYGRVRGRVIALSANERTARQVLAQKLREADAPPVGYDRPLAEHLDAWQVDLDHHGGGAKYIRETLACVRAILAAGKIVRPEDLTPARVQAAVETVGRNLASKTQALYL